MTFSALNDAYEQWLRRQCDVVGADLADKHALMAKDPFRFLRATCFRWASRVPTLFPALAGAPAVLSPGDVHAENFGTWRDAEGRFVWGLNDFDEAAELPYTFDLLRLATSLRLRSPAAGRSRPAVAAMLDGYQAGLRAPVPGLLDETLTPLRPYVAARQADCDRFWAKIKDLPDADPPPEVRDALAASMPEGAAVTRWASRQAGGGSLGRPRYVAVATWRGGRVVREAKALVPSAWDWAAGKADLLPPVMALAGSASRAPDPHLGVRGRYVIRRLAPDARKLDLGDDSQFPPDEMLRAMGLDLGALHAGLQPGSTRIPDDLAARARRDADWLRDASRTAAEWVTQDFHAWKAARED
ncbi:DUF2252 domain-containing protein [Roseomonas sp. NAR14]|uniref:DUF2252 domain-containing protein n=1 Tax=Roseomonas acroporae TaxID=2937791 RepID=A0A9X1Y546_9PROT|nr:DUF2252 family protein [Roseomonas acroporae]MCK8783666.1 DUF2252 domain-containing protein [Roseomonas acroporae]